MIDIPVRAEAATFAAAVAPLMIKSDRSSSGGGGGGGGSSGPMSPSPSGGGANDNAANGPLSSLDDAMHIALKNLDDESAGVAIGWADALARCLCTLIEAGEKSKAEGDSTGNRHSADDGDGAAPVGSGHGSASSSGDFASKFKAFSEGKGGGRTMSYCASCTSLVAALDFLVSRFVKVGGEYSASKCGGAFSAGGRAVRVGISSVMVELLKLQASTNSAALSGSAATDVLVSILGMVDRRWSSNFSNLCPVADMVEVAAVAISASPILSKLLLRQLQGPPTALRALREEVPYFPRIAR